MCIVLYLLILLSATGGLFGTPTATTASTGSLFGNTGGTSGGLFGGSTNTGTSLFGNNTNTGGTSLFGNKAGTSLFGNTTSTGTTSLFGSQPSTGGTSLFGNTQQQVTVMFSRQIIFLKWQSEKTNVLLFKDVYLLWLRISAVIYCQLLCPHSGEYEFVR